MRALFVLSSGHPGGAEISAITHLTQLRSELSPEVLLLGPGPISTELDSLGIRTVIRDLGRRPSALSIMRFESWLVGYLRRTRPHVIVGIGTKAAVACVPVAKLARVPLVWHKVDLTYGARSVNTVSRLFSAVIPISAATGTNVAKSRLMPSVAPGVRLDDAYLVSDPRPPAVLGSIGRLVPMKGHDRVIQAAALVRDRFPAVEVVIAGASSLSHPYYSEYLLDLAVRLEIAERVTVLGHVDSIDTVLDRLTICVSASHPAEPGLGFEGLGIAAVEASWAGLPVVATRGGGIAEAVVHGRTGLLVYPPTPVELSAAIERYLANPAEARGAGAAGAEFARLHFEPRAQALKLAGILRSVSRQDRPRRMAH